ncbi:MAG: molybdopterin cofactor-binding domain-containing protein [Acidobacteriota bacterium]
MSASTSRRDFLRGGLAFGAGLVVGFHWSRGHLAASTGAGLGPMVPSSHAIGDAFAPNAFVRIGSDDIVRVVSKHIEFGQGTYTGLATILAEELDADWTTIRVESSASDTARYANLAFGQMGTGGSTAIPNSWMQFRQAGATARALLVAAAADAWDVSASEISVSQGVVSHAASGRSARFGELADRAGQLEPPTDVAVKDPSEFTLIGTDTARRVDIPAKSDGTAIFTADIQLPGMTTALLARPPRFGATVASFDATDTRKVPGVVDVVEVPRGVAVVAESFWAAKKGRDALRVTWNERAAEWRGSDDIAREYRALAQHRGMKVARHGDPETAIDGATQVLEAEFEFPFLAHAPMEPLDAVAHLREDGADLWAGSQLQTLDQTVAAAAFGLPPEKVAVHTMLAGGSFGRRATPDGDVASEAASIAKALADQGKRNPVKVMWTREDDVRGGRYRPMYIHRLRAGLDASGGIVGWQHRIVGQSVQRGTPFEAFLVRNGIDNTSVEGAGNLAYAPKISGFDVDLVTTQTGIPVLWWRSVGHTHTAYTTEVFFDELARAAGRDPVEMRLAMLDEAHARHRAVLELAADKAGWGTDPPAGRARGVALHESFGSFIAQIAEVSLGDDGMPRVHKVVCAVDCGIAINPDNIRAQIEGGIGYGLGAALFDEVVIESGRVVTSNFHDYRSLRIHEMPAVEVHIVASGEAPTGIGEPGVPPIAPAVANAHAALTGTVVRRLPFSRSLQGA